MPRFGLACVSLLAVLCLLACTGAATPDAPTPTPTQSIKVLESLIAVATRTAPLPPTPTPAPPTPLPTSTPTLAEVDGTRVSVFLYREHHSDFLEVWANHPFNVEVGEFTVNVEGADYCYTARSLVSEDGDSYRMEWCSPPFLAGINHASFDFVSVHFPKYGVYRCERNHNSNAETSIFACELETPAPQ